MMYGPWSFYEPKSSVDTPSYEFFGELNATSRNTINMNRPDSILSSHRYWIIQSKEI